MWKIIDYLQWDWSALLTCTKVCRTWHVRARLYLPQGTENAVELHSRTEVILLSRCARSRQLDTRAIHIYGDHHSGSLAHLGTFVAMLSGWLNQLEELYIIRGVWSAATVNSRSLSRCLSTFATIQRLHLHDVTLPSTMVIVQLLLALSRIIAFVVPMSYRKIGDTAMRCACFQLQMIYMGETNSFWTVPTETTYVSFWLQRILDAHVG